MLKRSELPTGFWRWILKGNSGGVVAGCLSIFQIFLNWLLAEGDILGVNIINLVFPAGLRSICWLLVVSICGNLVSIKTTQEGLPWWSNVEDSGLPIHGVRLWTLLRELDAPRSNEDERSHGPQLRLVQQNKYRSTFFFFLSTLGMCFRHCYQCSIGRSCVSAIRLIYCLKCYQFAGPITILCWYMFTFS